MDSVGTNKTDVDRRDHSMDREEAKKLRVPCDKNKAWVSVWLVVELWAETIIKDSVDVSQVKKFKELLVGFLMVAHDKGEPVRLYKETFDKQGRVIGYTLLRSAIEFAGMTEANFNSEVNRVTLYPSGDIKVKRGDRSVYWM